MMQLKVHRGSAGNSSYIDLKPSAKIHIMGVCGTAMSSLAGLLKESGYYISGSDRQFYPPVSEQLKQLNIKTFKGFNAENLQADMDLIVVGNVISKNLPEAQAVLENNLPYVSLPEILNALIIQNKKTVMVTGTHGKTTVSFLSTWLLDQCDLKPGFMIGGVSENFKKSFCLQKSSDWFVVEGDEYDTAFFEKTPKFLHYSATHTILTGIEFDHADIYKNIDEVEDAFRLLLEKQTSASVLIACLDCPLVKKLISRISSKPQLFTYGVKEGDYRLVDRKIFVENRGQVIKVQGPDQIIEDIQIPLNGEHNALNALSVWILSRVLCLPKERVLSAFKSFKGVRRRFQALGVFNGVTLIEDFAHHPSAVSAVIQSTREAYPGRRILTLFEPRSNTSRKNIFQQEYEKTLQQSDLVFCRSVRSTAQIPESELFSAQKLAESINKKSLEKAFFAEDVGALTHLVQRNAKEGDVVLILSNGDFGGIYSLLKEAFS